MYSPETLQRVHELRSKCTTGQALTMEEMREAIILIRGTNRAAATTASSTTRAKKAPVNTGDLLSELDDL